MRSSRGGAAVSRALPRRKKRREREGESERPGERGIQREKQCVRCQLAERRSRGPVGFLREVGAASRERVLPRLQPRRIGPNDLGPPSPRFERALISLLSLCKYVCTYRTGAHEKGGGFRAPPPCRSSSSPPRLRPRFTAIRFLPS